MQLQNLEKSVRKFFLRIKFENVNYLVIFSILISVTNILKGKLGECDCYSAFGPIIVHMIWEKFKSVCNFTVDYFSQQNNKE